MQFHLLLRLFDAMTTKKSENTDHSLPQTCQACSETRSREFDCTAMKEWMETADPDCSEFDRAQNRIASDAIYNVTLIL